MSMDDVDFDAVEAWLKRNAVVWGGIAAIYLIVGGYAAWKCFQSWKELKRLP